MVVMVGCSNDSLVSSTSDIHSNHHKKEIVESSKLKTNINDYTIVDKNKTLQINKISDRSFKHLQEELDTHGRFGRGGMNLSLIDYNYSICELRRVNLKNKNMYYCIFSDKNDEKRIYIFFWKLDEWCCYDYVKIKTDLTKSYSEQNKDIVKCISPLDLQ